MIDYNIVKVENTSSNKIIIKNLSLDFKLDFFMVIDSNDKDYANIIENKILDFIIDKISLENTYKDFSAALEKINNILKEYNKDIKEQKYLNILLSVLNKDEFIFSNIWTSSLYLIKHTNETIEITEKNENKKEFNYIFEWNLENNDILIISTCRLLEYLSYSDFTDSVSLSQINKINRNIELILNSEKLSKNIWTLAIKYINEDIIKEKKSEFLDKISKISFKLMDNNFIKIIIAYFKIVKEKIEEKSKLVKNLLLVSGMIIATILLFQILSGTIWTITTSNNKENNLILLETARKHKTIASDNYTNSDVFNLHIYKSEEIVEELKTKKLFLDDLKTLEEQLSIIKKTFNRIEPWEEGEKHLIYKIPEKYKKDLVKILKINKKLYLITKTSVIWPIWNEREPQLNIFKDLKTDEYIDWTELKWKIILLTKNWKIVEFRTSWNFSFKDVLNQETWEEAKSITNYASNIYLISKNTNQIFKHSIYWNNFKKAEPYLKPEDSKSTKILDIAIDWGFYILKQDLSIVKFFSSPYRFETITINNLPENYTKSNNGKIKIIARKDLNYVYLLLNNKIWILKPNTKFYKKTKSLKYLGQIESNWEKITNFFVEKDWTLIILNKNWIYNITFNENDGKILVNN